MAYAVMRFLPEKERNAVLMQRAGFSWEKIAKYLEVDVKGAKELWENGLRRLKRLKDG